ncbi:hypothetical protein SESBI_29260 [Sesbania bispinosa]|nr:hypothetical protein SESBI_29260 [Sesbania bispinosa]
MARHFSVPRLNGEGASASNSRYPRQRRLRNLTNEKMFTNRGAFDAEEEGEIDDNEEQGEGMEVTNNGDDANMEHGETNGLIPIVNDLDRSITAPVNAPDDSNANYAMLRDTYVLDCCVCSEPLSFPVFQVFLPLSYHY